MTSTWRGILAFLLVQCIAPAVYAQDLVEFENGQVANADDINTNFQILNDNLATVYDDPSNRENQWHRLYIDVDCTEDSSALETAYTETLNKDRLVFSITGTCVFQDALDIAARYISITGPLTEDYSDCATPMPVLVTQGGLESDYGTNILVNNSGSLNLNCITLGDPERDDGSALVQAFANSMIRMDRIVEAVDGGILTVNVRQAGLFRYLGYGQDHGFSGALYSRMGKSELYGGATNISFLVLRNGSKFNCHVCGGSLDFVALEDGSSMYFRPIYGDVLINEASLEPGSQIYAGSYNDFDVTISTLNYRDPAAWGKTIYSGSDLAP